MRSLLCFLLSAAVLFCCGVVFADNEVFRAQADSFIASMTPSSQKAQASAILKAVAGDCAELNAIRASRNKVSEVRAGVRVTEISDSLRLYTPADSTLRALPLLVYLHGGGWTIGSINSCMDFCADMAAAGVAVLAVEYPLAPEHPFPAALEFCKASIDTAYSRAAEWGVDSCRVSVGGDSSGGNLAIASALDYVAGGGKLCSVVAFYPVVSAHSDTTGSWREYGNGYALDSDYMEALNAAYLSGGASAANPLVFPDNASDALLAKLPAMLVIAADRDILRDSALDFAKRVGRCGVPVRSETLPGSVHLFITVPGQPAARAAAVARTRSFLLD